jgi:hypothetical protein
MVEVGEVHFILKGWRGECLELIVNSPIHVKKNEDRFSSSTLKTETWRVWKLTS